MYRDTTPVGKQEINLYVIVATLPRNSPGDFYRKGVETHSSRFVGGDSSQLVSTILVKGTLGAK